jgi:hypothetical protein
LKTAHALSSSSISLWNIVFKKKNDYVLSLGQASTSKESVSHRLVSKVRASGQLALCFKRHSSEMLIDAATLQCQQLHVLLLSLVSGASHIRPLNTKHRKNSWEK